MSEDEREGFLARWSRRKREAAAAPATPAAPVAAPVPRAEDLPPVESLDFDADFSGFLRAKVEASVKRAALQKLFHSPHFNRMDGLDVYIDDYNQFEPIPEEMLRQLAHARETLFPSGREGAQDVAAAGEAAAAPPVAEAAPAATAEAAPAATAAADPLAEPVSPQSDKS